jgi:ATP-binding cassette subfamily F protein 3
VSFEIAERGGDRVVSAVNATIRVEDRTLVDKCTATLMRGDVLGLIGPNGSGKSTFLKGLFGDHPVASGELKLGGSITAAFYRQDMSQVPMGTTLYDIINELRPTWERRFIQGHLGRFGFSGEEAQRVADTLSGGERARVALAMLMLSRSNLLVLDEPTNHLDVESIEVLEDAIEDYEGTVLLVSHDRELLRALTTRVWILHDRHITDFDGGFAEWESVSAERAHAASVRAAEEEQVRRVKERKKVEPRREDASKDERKKQRSAQAELERAEARITELETKIAKVTAALEDPELYTKSGGVEQAAKLGRDMETLKRDLDAAMATWAAAAEG